MIYQKLYLNILELLDPVGSEDLSKEGTER